MLLFCFVFREYDSWDLMIDVNVKGHLHLMGKYKETPSPRDQGTSKPPKLYLFRRVCSLDEGKGKGAYY